MSFYRFEFTPAIAPITEAPIDLALRCDLSECELPYCYCSKDGTNIPKDLPAEDVSQKRKFLRSNKSCGWEKRRMKIIRIVAAGKKKERVKSCHNLDGEKSLLTSA